MATKTSVLVVAGLAGIAVIAGVTTAIQQAQSPQPEPSVVSSAPAKPSPSPTEIPNTPTSPAPSSTTPSNTPTSPAPSSRVPSSSPMSPAPQTPTSRSSPNRSDSTPKSRAPEPSEPSAPAETSRKVERCIIQMAKVNDPDSPLNVRSSPTTETRDNILGKLKNGTFVTVKGEEDGWFRINIPMEGWIAKSRTESTCGIKTERVQFGKGQISTTIDDRFIGTGSHQYRFNLAKGQRLTLTAQRGPLPSIVAPNGTRLTGMRDDQESWTGELQVTGDYTVELESNFKGYKYSFAINVK